MYGAIVWLLCMNSFTWREKVSDCCDAVSRGERQCLLCINSLMTSCILTVWCGERQCLTVLYQQFDVERTQCLLCIDSLMCRDDCCLWTVDVERHSVCMVSTVWCRERWLLCINSLMWRDTVSFVYRQFDVERDDRCVSTVWCRERQCLTVMYQQFDVERHSVGCVFLQPLPLALPLVLCDVPSV